jgi:hypothetical protein
MKRDCRCCSQEGDPNGPAVRASGQWAWRVFQAVCGGLVAVGAMGGCLFLPSIADAGYVECRTSDVCAVGWSCVPAVGLCAPPPWHDETFTERRLLVVTNDSDLLLPAGTAVPVRVADNDGVLALSDVGSDAHLADFNPETATWRVVSVYRDLSRDRYDLWIPLARPLGAGKRDALAWLETRTKDGAERIALEPQSVFSQFDECDDFVAEGDERRFVDAPGAAEVVVGEGTVEVTDNASVVWREGTASPVSVTFRARVNGISCDQVFLGLTSASDAVFVSPSAGFFMQSDLQAIAEVIAAPNLLPMSSGAPRAFSEVPNDEHRFTVSVEGSRARFEVDGVLFEEIVDIDPPLSAGPLFPTVQVGGTCSVTIDAVWSTTLPLERPTVVAEPTISLNITY